MKLDSYVLQARVAPVLIVLAPAIAMFAAVAGAEDAGTWSAALLAVSGTAVGLALSDAARRRGRALEQQRWTNTGSPTIVAIRAATAEGDRIRSALEDLFGLPVDTREEAERAAEALRSHARRSANAAVAAANIEYGRARNLLAIRWYGLGIAAACMLLSLAAICRLVPSSIEALVRVSGWSLGLVFTVSLVVLAHLAIHANAAALDEMDALYTKRLIGYLDLISVDDVDTPAE
jgi:hypothetical protein